MDPLLAHLVEAASRAPSAHNTQPWRLRWQEHRLQVRVAENRILHAADPQGFDALHALGAVLENLLLTLCQLGFKGEYEVAEHWDLGKPVITLSWHADPTHAAEPRLYRMIPTRRTSRVQYFDELIPDAILDDIRAAALCSTKLHILTDIAAKNEIRSLATSAGADALRNKSYASELYDWMRFSRADSRWYHDGLNAECMGWNPMEAAFAKRLLRPAIAGILAHSWWSKWLYRNPDQQAPFAPAICLLTTRDASIAGRVRAGRSLQRVWLTAAAHGLVTHPLSAAVDDPKSRGRVFELFGVPAQETHVNLFRLGKSAKTARSARLPADELLEPYA